MIARTCYECWMVNENIGPTQLSNIYNNNTVWIKDLDNTSLHSLQSYVEVVAQGAKGRRLHGAMQECTFGSRTS